MHKAPSEEQAQMAIRTPRLSSPLDQLKPEYPVVVIGSGYGGGVSASRLARAGQEVCVLERGREYLPGDFPNTELEMMAEVQVSAPGAAGQSLGHPLALQDYLMDDDMTVLRGCGLGGTSLVNAGVSLWPDPRVFEDPVWPAELRGDMNGLAAGRERALAMLQPRTWPAERPRLPKMEAHRRSAERMGEPFSLTPINVAFEEGRSAAGMPQGACTACGDCVTGCNVGAKTTVAHTWLADARRHGAQIFTELTVDRLERRPDGRWALVVRPTGAGRERFDRDGTMVILAEVVVLAAGTLGSAELLLRSREAGLSLSPRLGQRFSGNGDVLAFGYNNDLRIHGVGDGARPPSPADPVGPTITSMVDGRRPERPLSAQYLLQEGSLPGPIDAVYVGAFLTAWARWGVDTDSGLRDALAEQRRSAQSALLGPRVGAVDHSQTYLGMGHDSAAGELELDEQRRLRVRWAGASGELEPLRERGLQATAALGGTWMPNPLARMGAITDPISVHPLGGCAMGEDARSGVTDHRGRVYAGGEGHEVHAGLYVMDASVIPRSLGVNPLLTISALAERNIALLAAERGWTISTGEGGPLPPADSRVGLRFTERMSGSLAMDPAGQLRPDQAPRQAGASACSFILTLSTEDLDRCLGDEGHPMDIVGTVEAPALAPGVLQVRRGRFSLLSRSPSAIETRQMVYEMELMAEGGAVYQFRGVKTIYDDPGPDLWADTTTLAVEVHQADRRVAVAELRISVEDFARQLRTIGVVGTGSISAGLSARLRFGRFFCGALFDVYGDIFAGAADFNPHAPPRRRRSLRCPAPRLLPFRTRDHQDLWLTRYAAGTRGPVLLLHGLGVSSRIFTVDTVETNLVEALCAEGYDVWLLDYRASMDLAASRAQISLDDIAAIDIPEAVQRVLAHTGAPSLQLVAHCVGATTFFMSMLSGALKGVRSAVTSQTSPLVAGTPGVRLKSGLHLPDALSRLRIPGLDARAEQGRGWSERIYDRALQLYPLQREERCQSATCHRITFMYSLLYEHDQLAPATHDTLHELFGEASMSAFQQLAAMVRAGHLVDQQGRDVYLPHVQRLALPLLMLHGAENECFLPEGSARSLEWLHQHLDPALSERVLIPDHGHIDCIFGKNAARDVYPHILRHLGAHA